MSSRSRRAIDDYDVTGGEADIAAAKAMKGDVADLYATWGVSAP